MKHTIAILMFGLAASFAVQANQYQNQDALNFGNGFSFEIDTGSVGSMVPEAGGDGLQVETDKTVSNRTSRAVTGDRKCTQDRLGDCLAYADVYAQAVTTQTRTKTYLVGGGLESRQLIGETIQNDVSSCKFVYRNRSGSWSTTFGRGECSSFF